MRVRTLVAVGVVGTIAVACSSTYGTGDGAPPDIASDAGNGDAIASPDTSTTDAGADALAPRGAHVFSKSFGGPEEDYLTRANVNLSGNLLLAGSFGDTLDFGSGPLTTAGTLDIYFTKFDPTGKNVFSKSYGDAVGQNGVNIVGTGSGDIFATGVFTGSFMGPSGLVTATDGEFDSLLVRYGSDGMVKNTFVLSGSGRQFVNGLAYDGSHGVYFTGNNNGAVPAPNAVTTIGGNDLLIGHTVSTQDWTRDVGDLSEQFGSDIAYDPAGSVVVFGYFGGTIDFGDNSPHTSAGGYDVFVARVSPAGAPMWSKAFGAAGDQQSGFVAITPTGEIVIAGTFTGTMTIGTDLASAGAIDIFVAKLAADGTPIWSKRFGGAADDSPGGLAIAPNGDILLGGKSNGDIDFGLGPLSPAGDADAFVVRFDKDGTPIWNKRFGDAGFQNINGVGVTLTNEVWVAGYYTGTIDLGGGPLTSAGKHDIFIARFTP